MTYELIRNFVTVAKTKSITRAAEILFVSQSTVSHRLRLLEEETGHCLIFRGKGKRLASLTPWGADFLPIAEKWLALWQETEAFCKEETEHTLSVACVNSLVVCLLRRFFSEFMQRHPHIHLRLTVLDTNIIYQMLNAREIDVGIVLANLPQETVNIRPLLSEKMYCACHPEMIPNRQRIRTDDLDPHKEILLNWNLDFILWHDFRFPQSTKPRMEVNTIMLVEDALHVEGTWAVVPQTVAEHFLDRGVCRCVELEAPPPDRVSYVVSRLVPDPHAQELITLFNRELDAFVADYRKQHVSIKNS